MKKLILIFVLLCSPLYSQVVLTTEQELEPYLIEFLNEGLERDLDLQDLVLKNLDTLMFDKNITYPLFGFYQPTDKSIKIAPFCSVDDIILRSVVFHELSHIFLKEHYCDYCTDIMSSNPPDSFFIYYDNEYWEKNLDTLFERISETLKKY